MTKSNKQNGINKETNTDNALKALVAVMVRLRDADSGCPWDIEQNFKTIAPYTIEEAYEVADAIDREDMDNLREELGDLLFQVIFHAQMAAEENAFTIDDVIKDVTDKMIYRHPHVFGEQSANSADDVNAIWDIQKDKEKSKKSSLPESALDGVPYNLPSLIRAQKLQKKAAKTGFEWSNVNGLLDKFEEEIHELREAIANEDQINKEEELGDLLFLLAKLGRFMEISAEESLRQCCLKFERRFKSMEKDIKGQYEKISDLSDAEMMRLWRKQKDKEKKGNNHG